MYSEEELDKLRESVKARLSDKRFRHTLGVEKMAAHLGDFCLPKKKQELRAAALLHDVAKELPQEEILALIKKANIKLTKDELSAEAPLHSFASVALIKRDFPKFAKRNILLACKNHTLGSPRMSLFEEIIFLSDFIEEGRTYEDSVKLCQFVLSSLGENHSENLKTIHRATLSSLNSTIAHLEAKNKFINPKTLLTRNSFLTKI